MPTSVLLAMARGKEVDQVEPFRSYADVHETSEAHVWAQEGGNVYEVFLGGLRVRDRDSARARSELAVGDRFEAASGAAADDALQVALAYVDRHPAKLGVTRADVADLFATSTVKSAHSGVTHVNLNQRFQGLEVFGGHATVNVGAGGKVTFAAGSFVNGLRIASSADADTDATEAVEAAGDALDLADPSGLRVLRRSGGPPTRRSSPAAGSRTSRSRRGWAGSPPRRGCAWPGSLRSMTPPAGISGTRPWTPRPASCSTRPTGPRTTPGPVSRAGSAAPATRHPARRSARAARSSRHRTR